MGRGDKWKGQAKEAIAEVLGDGSLAREGKAQQERSNRPGETPKRDVGDTAPTSPTEEQWSDFDPEKVAYYP
jgi:hypothetical protein